MCIFKWIFKWILQKWTSEKKTFGIHRKWHQNPPSSPWRSAVKLTDVHGTVYGRWMASWTVLGWRSVDTCCYNKVQVTRYVKKLKDFFPAPRFPCWMKSKHGNQQGQRLGEKMQCWKASFFPSWPAWLVPMLNTYAMCICVICNNV